jgi:hypothetical protein
MSAKKGRPHPMQEVVMVDGIVRFRQNPLVDALCKSFPGGLNALYSVPHTKEDWSQLLQLTGYSVAGYGDCTEIVQEHLEIADRLANELVNKGRCRGPRK